MHDDCIKQEQWGALGEKLKQYDRHLEDADAKGGFRDRVCDLERSNKLMPYICAVCAFCGGLLGRSAPDAVNAIASAIKAFAGVQ